jgi:hypothetical protein
MRYRFLALLAGLASLAACRVYDPALLDSSLHDDAADTGDAAPDGPCTGVVCGESRCVSLQTDVHHCGACGNDCTLLPGVIAGAVRCMAGTCNVTGACQPGRAHCSSNPQDGCEADITTATQCGRCGTACAEPTPLCSAQSADGGTVYRCISSCTGATPDRCESRCVNTQTDPLHCGGCGNECTGADHAPPSCTDGVCAQTCEPGFDDCDGDPSNGCEIEVRTDVVHCGSCGNECPGGAHATAGCSDGACGLVCDTGFGDCDGMASTGCETDVRTDVAHCGSCGNVCPAVANGTPACVARACSATCNTGYVLFEGRCQRPGPRPISPLSTSYVNQRRPQLRWVMAPGTDGVRVEICRERDCTSLITSFDVGGSSTGQPPADLTASASGLYYWRLRGLLGSTAVTAPGPTWQFTVGARTATSGPNTFAGTDSDFDGDGVSDVLVSSHGNKSAYVYMGDRGSVLPTSRRLGGLLGDVSFGYALASVGDVNGDGYGDAVISDPGARAVYVLHGDPTGLPRFASTTLSGTATGYGTVVSAAGDTNGDGYADVLVAAPGATTVYLYLGSADGIQTTPSQTLRALAESGFGSAVASAGDVNGDRYGDVLIGSPDSGRVYLYLGAAGTGLPSTATQTLTAPMGAMSFGTAVAGVGDVNSDGYGDVVIGAPGSNNAFLYTGRSSGLSTTSSTLTPPGSANAMRFGAAVSGAGDVDRDGYADVVIGASSSSQAFVFTGNASGVGFSTQLPDAPPASGFGISVACAGDIDRDGFADVIVGANLANKALVYRGGIPFPAPTTILTAPPGANGFGFAVASAAPVCRAVRPPRG